MKWAVVVSVHGTHRQTGMPPGARVAGVLCKNEKQAREYADYILWASEFYSDVQVTVSPVFRYRKRGLSLSGVWLKCRRVFGGWYRHDQRKTSPQEGGS